MSLGFISMKRGVTHAVLGCSLIMGSMAVVTSAHATTKFEDWKSWGQNINNTHYNPDSGINEGEIKKLTELCKIDYMKYSVVSDSSTRSANAKPLIVDDTIYWTAFSGQIGAHKVLRDQSGKFTGCKELWVQDVSNVLGLQENGGPVTSKEPATRNSPAYYTQKNGKGALLYTGVASSFTLPFSQWFTTPPYAYALDAETGAKLWQIALAGPSGTDPDAFFPSTTASPRVHNGVAYIGLASLNNALNGPPFFLPLTFRGQMIALDLGINSGTPSIKWKQYTVPKKPAGHTGQWFAGGGVWSSAPSIIPEKNLVLFGSGQLYAYPDFVGQCMSKPKNVTTATFSTTKKGETGIGAKECLADATAKLKQMGINHPIATNSIIALNMNDGSFAWHVPTAGIDSWQAGCGINAEYPCPDPNNISGPDWDISGNSPLVIKLGNKGDGASAKTIVVSHNKGGSLWWIDASNGKVIRSADVCVGSALGGIHWGISYDPISETLLVPCAAGGNAPAFGNLDVFPSTLADGRTTCATGYLNGLDVHTGKLKWQTLPASNEVNQSASCASTPKYNLDERFKYGLNFDLVLRNKTFSDVPVNVMPSSNKMPLVGQGKASANGAPSNSHGIAYWPVYNGTVYAVDVKTGKYLNQMFCDEGAAYGGPSVANGLVSFTCGYGFAGGPADEGKSIMVYGLPQYMKN